MLACVKDRAKMLQWNNWKPSSLTFLSQVPNEAVILCPPPPPQKKAYAGTGTLKPEAKILTHSTSVQASSWRLEMWLQQCCGKSVTLTALLSSLSLHTNRMGRAYLSDKIEQEENERRNFVFFLNRHHWCYQHSSNSSCFTGLLQYLSETLLEIVSWIILTVCLNSFFQHE